MGPERFREFTERLRARLQVEPGVLGLVALGSTADTERPPDEGSDHDVWVVTEPGRQEGLRQRQDWLPDAERVVLAFRETAHGVKVVYDDGHLVEHAVFALDELSVARANVYRVLFDRADVARRVADCAARGRAVAPADARWLGGQVLTHLLVGVARWRRGERLSGHRFVRVHALDHLVQLVAHLDPARPEGQPDGLDAYRRFERSHPRWASALDLATDAPVPEAARRMLDVLAELCVARPDDLPPRAVEVARRVLAGPGWEPVRSRPRSSRSRAPSPSATE